MMCVALIVILLSYVVTLGGGSHCDDVSRREGGGVKVMWRHIRHICSVGRHNGRPNSRRQLAVCDRMSRPKTFRNIVLEFHAIFCIKLTVDNFHNRQFLYTRLPAERSKRLVTSYLIEVQRSVTKWNERGGDQIFLKTAGHHLWATPF